MASSSQGVQSVLKKGAIWQDEEVDALITLWGEEDIQAKLKGTTRNIELFETISNKLKDLGFEGRTAVQCREKVFKNSRPITARRRLTTTGLAGTAKQVGTWISWTQHWGTAQPRSLQWFFKVPSRRQIPEKKVIWR